MRLPASLEVLRARDFRLLFSAQAVSLVGDGMVNVALAFAVLDLTGSATDVGFVLAARTAPQVLFVLLGGVVADRLSRRSVMVGADVSRLASQGAMAALLVSGLAEVWSLMALAAVSGAATSFFKPASSGLTPMVVDDQHLLRANALINSARALGIFVGPVLAGVLVVAVGAGWAIALDAATFGVSAVLLYRLRLARQARLPVRSIAQDLREGWDTFRSRTWLWALTLRDAMDNLLFACWNVLGPLVAVRALGGALAWGIIVAMFGAGLLAGGALALRLEPRRPLVVVTAPAMLTAPPLALLALDAPTPTIAVGAFASGVGTMVGLTVWYTTLQRHIPPAALSRVTAYDWLGSMAAQPIGLAAWAPIAAVVGLSGALWTAGALVVVSTLAVLAMPSVRNLPAHPEQMSAPAS